MSRFVNRIPKVYIGEAGRSYLDRMRIAYNKAAHSDDYMPDRWNITWGRYAKDLAQLVIDSQKHDASGNVEQFFRSLWNLVPKDDKRYDTKESVNEAKNRKIDFRYYADLCSHAISQLQEKSAEFVETLGKGKFWKYDFESRPKVDALYTILRDSFDPEKAMDGDGIRSSDAKGDSSGTGDTGADDGDDAWVDDEGWEEDPDPDDSGFDGDADDSGVDGDTETGDGADVGIGKDPVEGKSADGAADKKDVATSGSDVPTSTALPELQKSYQPRHVNKAKPKSYEDGYDMLSDFRANYDKNGAITKRIVYAMFDEVNKMRRENGGKPVGPDKAKEVAQRALNSIGSGNAARAVV